MKTNSTLKSIGAIVAGLLATVILSYITDFVLEKTGLLVQPFSDNSVWIVLLIILYRNIYNVIGCYIAAKLAPKNPMKHAWILGGIGFVLSLLGTIVMWNLGTQWYSISLVVLALPCAWLGGKLNNLITHSPKQLV
jgi:hypothetical protein